MTAVRRSTTKVERGDFQTPLELARAVLHQVATRGFVPATVLEPTCGRGAFLRGASEVFPDAALVGLDIDPLYVEAARSAAPRARVECADFFTVEWERFREELVGPVLVVGNPPWVTSAGLGAIGGANAPTKSNADGLRGLEARTGSANFDISEWMIARLLEAFSPTPFHLAMLVKAAVVRKLLVRCARRNTPHVGSFRRIDAREHFGASVEAGLLEMHVDASAGSSPSWSVYDRLEDATPRTSMACIDGFVTEDPAAYARTRGLRGDKSAGWRSGLKHDCAEVFELTVEGERFRSASGVTVELERELVFPLLKGSDLSTGDLVPKRAVIVANRDLRVAAQTETKDLSKTAPLAHRYFEAHTHRLSRRMSSVFAGRPIHAVFGVGEYSFAPYKVVTSGLSKRLAFGVVGPHDGKPVMLDDTCYFLPFLDEHAALRAKEVLDSEDARDFFMARIFWDAKRPVTKKILDALSIERALETLSVA